MSLFYVEYDSATGDVLNDGMIPDVKPLPTAPSGHGILAVTEAQWGSVTGNLRFDGGPPRWKVVAGALQAKTDTRPILRCTPSTVEVQVGDAAPSVVAEAINPANGNRMTGVNQTTKVQVTISGTPKRVNLPLSAGTRTFQVPTGTARTIQVFPTADYQLEAPIVFEVLDSVF